ncbi:hypothetical protein V8J82_22285 [Gymnodinialimonas sp. 2305UL16-5]|uniref:hypothetical protein n=1 Tax=Gymnodinialimonas mytili TaxID=3126503 RepID=UPI0030B5C079
MRREDRLVNTEYATDAQFRALLEAGFELELIAHERMYKKHVSFAGTWSARVVHPLTGEARYLVTTSEALNNDGNFTMKEFNGILGIMSFVKSLGYLTVSLPIYATGWTRIGPTPALVARPENWEDPWARDADVSDS